MNPAPAAPASPVARVQALKQKMKGRVSGGCVYILPNELDILLALALEGAELIERRNTMLALLQQGRREPERLSA